MANLTPNPSDPALAVFFLAQVARMSPLHRDVLALLRARAQRALTPAELLELSTSVAEMSADMCRAVKQFPPGVYRHKTCRHFTVTGYNDRMADGVLLAGTTESGQFWDDVSPDELTPLPRLYH